MARPHSPFISFFCFVLSIIISTTAAASEKPTELVDKICSQIPNYTFCVDALYSDPRTSDADAYLLAYISFGLAYLNATATHDRIAELLRNASVGGRNRLRKCNRYYDKAVSALEEAYDDLNSETFFQLPDLAGRAARAADDCHSVFKGTHYSPLAAMNANLKALCQICVAVSKLFTALS